MICASRSCFMGENWTSLYRKCPGKMLWTLKDSVMNNALPKIYINLKINCIITREYFDPITVIIIDNVSIEHNAPYHSIVSMETEIIDWFRMVIKSWIKGEWRFLKIEIISIFVTAKYRKIYWLMTLSWVHLKYRNKFQFLINKQISLQECIPVGCVPSAAVVICWGVSVRGGVCRGVSAQEGCLPKRGVCLRGVSAWGVSAWGGICLGVVCPGGGCLPRRVCLQDRMTDACENIILPKLRCGR